MSRNRLMSDPPSVRGDYCFWTRWGSSAVPVYVSFNGTSWVRTRLDGGLETYECVGDDGSYYIDHPFPYGSENPEVLLPEDLPLKMDLASRLERFKKAKT